MRRLIALVAVIFLFPPTLLFSQEDPRNHVVEADATPDTDGILLRWRGTSDASGFIISRREGLNDAWIERARLGGGDTSWRDTTATPGKAYEYRIEKPTSRGYTGFGFISAGSNVPAVHSRGRIILVVESSLEGALASELAQLRTNLVGDGWTVRQVSAASSELPQAVRERIRTIWDQDRVNTKAVFLIGHVPVPYSGNIAPDGHENHRGAWPADLFYGEMDGTWTDNQVNSEIAEREINRNRPGDGKFDQSQIPGRVELAVGRVDFSEMTCFANKNPARSELDLLRAYFAKNHEFRNGRVQVNRKGFILDNFGLRGTNAVSANGWRNFSGFFGVNNVTELPLDTYFGTLQSDSALATWGAGGGSYYYTSGVGTSDDFALYNLRVVFTLWLGSYFGDWNNESNFLRAALGSGNVLVSMFSGLPHSFLHRMSLGETIGEGLLISQNNDNEDGYFPNGQGMHQVHISLMGDPTLRLHPVIPPSNLQATTAGGVRLSWSASTDTALQGYHVYRASAGGENFTLLNSEPISGTTYLDSPAAGEYKYMVRTVKREQSGTGSYFNLSQGVVVSATANSSNMQPELSVTREPTTLVIRITGQIGSTIEIQRSSNLKVWTAVTEVQVTSPTMTVRLPTRFGVEYFRARVKS